MQEDDDDDDDRVLHAAACDVELLHCADDDDQLVQAVDEYERSRHRPLHVTDWYILFCNSFFYNSFIYHRLNGSSSPVLTATCLSYGRLCDYFFSRTDLQVTPLDRF